MFAKVKGWVYSKIDQEYDSDPCGGAKPFKTFGIDFPTTFCEQTRFYSDFRDALWGPMALFWHARSSQSGAHQKQENHKSDRLENNREPG